MDQQNKIIRFLPYRNFFQYIHVHAEWDIEFKICEIKKTLNLNKLSFYWLNQLIFTDSPVKNIFAVKLFNFHWMNQWNLTDSDLEKILQRNLQLTVNDDKFSNFLQHSY